MLPEGWVSMRLGDFLVETKEVVAPVVWSDETPISVAMGGRGISPALRWKAERSKTPQQRVQAGDFVVLRQGAAGGGFAVVPEAFDKAILSTNFMRFAINDSIVDRKWWRWRIQSPAFTEMCARAGMGSAQSFLTARKLLALDVAVPVLSEQHRIVAVLEQADRAVEAAARHVADAEALLRMTIEAAVTPAERPTGWVDVALSEVVEKRSGHWGEAEPTVTRGQEAYVVTNAHISRTNHLTGWTTRYFSETEYGKARLVGGDVAMTGSGEIGKLYRATGEPAELCASNFVKVLRPDDRLDAGFLFYWLSSTLARSEMQAHTGGTTLKNLHASFFTDTNVSFPPLAEQQAIVARIEKVETAVRAAQAHLERLRALRSSLLENLVSGRVRLPMPDATASEVTA